MLSVTVAQLLTMVDSGALARLCENRLPAAVTFRLARLARLIRSEYGAADSARVSLFTESNSVPVTNQAGRRAIKPEFYPAFLADPLFCSRIFLDAEPLRAAELEAATISVSDLESLGPIVALD